MGKTIDMFPEKGEKKKQEKQNINEEEKVIQSFLDLLRAVVDGDKEAIAELRSMIEEVDEIGLYNHDCNSCDDEFDCADGLFDCENKSFFDYADDDDDDYDDDDDDDDFYDGAPFDLLSMHGPMTLPRDDVKECHVRIRLNHTDLKIWREIRVPSNITLEALAKILLDVMGWEHEHLYQFVKNNDYYELEIGDDVFSLFSRIRHLNMSKHTLSDVLNEKGKRIKFEYDFGDDWEHDVWIKGFREYSENEKPAIMFVKGQGACPPENCGGVEGYEELVALKNKNRLTKHDKEKLDWFGMLDGFSPDIFDKEIIEEMFVDWTYKMLDEMNK